MSVFGDITEAPPYGEITSTMEECYETMSIQFDCISKEITDLPNGLDGTPLPGGGFGPPKGTVNATLKFYGKIKNRKRYCAKPGLKGKTRASAELTTNTFALQRGPGRRLKFTSTMVHKITVSLVDWPCNRSCFPVEYDEDIVYTDGCTINFPDENIELEHQKYLNTPTSQIPFDQVIWNSHINKTNVPSLCFSPGINPYQRARLTDAIELLHNLEARGFAKGTCCNLTTSIDDADLLQQIKDQYNSTHNQSDCNPFLA